MYTAYVCLGGTGTQLGGVIGNLYPLLKLSGAAESPFSMFILDKDTNSGIYKACTGALQRYTGCHDLFPFETLPPWELTPTVYQEMQEASGFRNQDYTVMDLIGSDQPMKELASMCWLEEKRNESLRDGNNRDPSRGSLDAGVCLEHLAASSLFNGKDGKQGLENLVGKYGAGEVRVVLLGGVTGGMGSSLIVPLARKLRTHYPDLRIDMALLGTYFEIPQRSAVSPGAADVDNIGTSLDSFYRAADQIDELIAGTDGESAVSNTCHVYYAAMPKLDNTAGKFDKNGAVPRKAHLVELAAGLAALALDSKGAGFYETSLSYGNNKKTVGWTDIPLGTDLEKAARDFLKFVSVLVCGVYPALCAEKDKVQKDGYLKKYWGLMKNPAGDMEFVGKMRDALKVWLQNVSPYFNLWNEVQLSTHLGEKDGRRVAEFFPPQDMADLAGFLDFSKPPRFSEKLPLHEGKTWMLFLDDVKPDKKRLTDALSAEAKLKWMFGDIWNICHQEQGGQANG